MTSTSGKKLLNLQGLHYMNPKFGEPNLGGHWTDLNKTWTHIHFWLLFENFGPSFPKRLPHGLEGAKTLFCHRLYTSTEHISATEHDINNRKETCQSTWTPQSHMPPNLVWTLVQKRLRTVGAPPKCSHWETLPAASLTAWMLYNRQQANFGTCYVVARNSFWKIYCKGLFFKKTQKCLKKILTSCNCRPP